MTTKLQRDSGMYPARFGGQGRWPNHPDIHDLYPVPGEAGSTDDTVSFTPAIDANEVAYLRGGENAVLTVALFDLVQRGHLEVIETKKWLSTERRLSVAANPPSHDVLTEAEQDLVGRFNIPLTASETFSFGLTEPLRLICSGYQARLKETGLLRTQAQPKVSGRTLGLVWLGVFILLVAAKAPAPLFAACFLVLAAASIFSLSRLTREGKAELKQLERQFELLKDRPKAARLGYPDPTLLTAVAVFGVKVLVGSVYDAFAAAVRPLPKGDWSFGSGDGCGSDGCGGCGCGGD
jgi:uncharacterized protein (TIGR04222 family)